MSRRKNWLKYISSILGILIVLVVLPLSFPKILFANSVSIEGLSIYSDLEIPKKEATAILSKVRASLELSPLQNHAEEMQIYVANNQLLRKWLWLAVPKNAGGFVLRPFTRNHAFFSGADFQANTLIGPSGYRPAPPRDLAYYGAHELTHVSTANAVGSFRLQTMPVWVREGIADYVAMPDESAASLYSKIGSKDSDLDMMNEHGVYAPYRLLVTYFLEDNEWSVEQLLESNLSISEAQALVYRELEKL